MNNDGLKQREKAILRGNQPTGCHYQSHQKTNMTEKEYDDLIEFISNDELVNWDVTGKGLSVVIKAIEKFYRSKQEKPARENLNHAVGYFAKGHVEV